MHLWISLSFFPYFALPILLFLFPEIIPTCRTSSRALLFGKTKTKHYLRMCKVLFLLQETHVTYIFSLVRLQEILLELYYAK